MARLLFVSAFVVVTLVSSVVWAGDNPDDSTFPQYRLSFSERLRLVSWDNAISLDDFAHAGNTFTRHRTNLMGQLYPVRDIELTLKLTNEFRYYLASPGHPDWDFHEAIVNQLYLKWHNHRALDAVITIGRQNIILGEGFVMMDGRPLDGSRSIGFNALRADLTFSPRYQATLFYAYQDAIDDRLPILHDQRQMLLESDREVLGVYGTISMGRYNVQTYGLHTNIPGLEWQMLMPFPQRSSAPGDISTVGMRFNGPLSSRLSGTIEGAFQFGNQSFYGDRRAFGGYAHLDLTTPWPNPVPQKITLGAIYLSGDDPESSNNEAWDPLFGRWPKWSESYIYTQLRDEGVAYWSNLGSVYASVSCQPAKDVDFSLTFHHLMAPEQGDPVHDGFHNCEGYIRGELIIGKLGYRINERLTGHFLWEAFVPGSYYMPTVDGYNWLRTELLLSI